MYLRYFALAVLLTLALVLTACGRGRRDSTNGNGYEDDPTVRTLSILAQDQFRWVIERTETALNTSWQAQHRNYEFQLELHMYTFNDPADVHGFQSRLRTALMAGIGYDMFLLGIQPLHIWPLAQSGALIDIYTLIDQDPHINRINFFEQALNAWEVDGGLYTFPLSFGFQYVSINASLPQSIIDRFTGYSHISFREMMSIYNELLERYAYEFGHLYFANCTNLQNTPIVIFESYIDNFIDYDNRTSDLTNENFIEFLAELHSVFGTYERRFHGMHLVLRNYAFSSHIARYYAFNIDTTRLSPVLAFADTPHFVYGRPLSNGYGRLLLDWWRSPHESYSPMAPSTWTAVCISASGDSVLAWEFTQYLLQVFSRSITPQSGNWGTYSMVSPISRQLLRPHMTTAFATLDSYTTRLGTARHRNRLGHGGEKSHQEWDDLIEHTITQFEILNEMPMVRPDSHIPRSMYAYNFGLFMDGIIRAEEFAQRLQNAVSLWLIE